MDLDHEDLLVNSAVKVITIKAAYPRNELRFRAARDLHHPFEKGHNDIVRVRNGSRSTLSETTSDGEGADAVKLSERLFAIVTFRLAQRLLYHPTQPRVFDLHHFLGS